MLLSTRISVRDMSAYFVTPVCDIHSIFLKLCFQIIGWYEEEFRWFIRILKKSKLYKGGGRGKKVMSYNY